jgi:SusD family.
MRQIFNYILGATLCLTFTQCKDYLDTSSPSNTDDAFVTSSPSETFKTLSWCYANYRQNCQSAYIWNDQFGSDSETYPENGSSNNINATLRPDKLVIDAVSGGFNGLYTTLARAAKVASIIKSKPEFQAGVASGKPTAWTQLYGESVTMWAFCYFNLVKHFGDVPFGYENTYVDNYTLTSRFDIYDALIESLKQAEPYMYKIGEGGITAERFSRTFTDALIGEIAFYSGGYQTVRTDVPGLYGSLQFTTKGAEKYGCKYARRTDYLDKIKIAEQYLQAALDNKGTAQLITADNRTYTNNPFQRHFQYAHDLQISPESLFELGNMQGGQAGQTTTSEYPYSFGRPSNGGSANSAPCKSFGALRIVPTVYYGEYEKGDKRRDVSVAVTGSAGDGNEAMLNFVANSKLSGGLAINKWDENRMNPPYVAGQRSSGINYPVLRMADVILMLAQSKALIGGSAKESEAITLVNQIRQRAFGDVLHNISGLTGQGLIDAIWQERKLELLGEGTRRWDLILSGQFSEKAVAVQNEMKQVVSDLQAQGYHQFANGNTISNYIWIKKVQLTSPLTYECADQNDPALYPGWRGQYNFSTIAAVASKVIGTAHNLAIQGLFTYIDPNGSSVPSGYTKTNWGVDIVSNATIIYSNLLPGITTTDEPPRYYWPIPYETISKSKGVVTNGYGLPNQ